MPAMVFDDGTEVVAFNIVGAASAAKQGLSKHSRLKPLPQT